MPVEQILWSEHAAPDFHLYIAAAMLHQARRDIVGRASTSDDVFRIVHRLAGALDLDTVRWTAEVLHSRASSPS